MSVGNFSWVIPKLIGGCALPDFSYGDNAAWLSAQGVDVLVSFVMPPGDAREECARNGIEWIYFPIVDFDIPKDHAAFSSLIDRIVEAMNQKKGVCLHCRAGVGRTGMGLACAVGKYLNLSAAKAVATVRSTRMSIETHAQEEYTRRFLDAL